MAKTIRIIENELEEHIEEIKKAQKMILDGKVVICGTDTLYGLCANALDSKAVMKIYDIKKRDTNKPISVSLKDKSDIEKYVYVDKKAQKIIDKFLPGPITLILKKKNGVNGIPDVVAKDYIGIRIPDNAVVRELAVVPLTSTSANLSGEGAPTSVDGISKELMEKVDLIIDTGSCKYKKQSTIVKIGKDGKLELIREGAIPFNDILKEVEK
ncbi:MAG: L-threonylcarbamoyladenylate synthase [Methanothermococcus sp.]|jgi:L-threonylcarbamoyladenylate synthase|uniref:L-threonylcarbamoyladenylate synthase n=1 Tax=Methanothermococcus TaxID=155862 RepID=UPI00036A0E8F|nr:MULTISPECIES: L-threonylcarbamoyladenylate synthase [Methanothermococcus]MDK2790340.1 L-threonylcarbamoyladenylate synthase [Methanothermococcus sp.]MDK2987693.1 L-threonylcarbamoyladenylate synthase [Methanothermococcus sp.]